MSKNKYYKIAGVLGVLLVVSLTTWSMRPLFSKHSGVPIASPVKHFQNTGRRDTALVAEFTSALDDMDPGKGDFTFEGKITIVDNSDSTGGSKNVPFLMLRSGQAFYYRLGETETINGQGVNLMIEHDQKLIYADKEKVIEGFNMLSGEQVHTMLVVENYQLRRSVSGALITYTLANPMHRLLKTYALTIDTVKKQAVHVMSRMSAPQEPYNTKFDKLINIDIKRVVQQADFASVTHIDDVVDKQYRLTERFKGFTLHKL